MARLAEALLSWFKVLPDLLTLWGRQLTLQERQTRALERLADHLETYIRLDPQYWHQQDVAQGLRSEDEQAAATALEVQTPAERQDLADRLAAFQALWWQQMGVWLEGDALLQAYEQEYAAAEERQRTQEDQAAGMGAAVQAAQGGVPS